MSDKIKAGDLVKYPDGVIMLVTRWIPGARYYAIPLEKLKNGNYKFSNEFAHGQEDWYKECDLGCIKKFKGKVTISQ